MKDGWWNKVKFFISNASEMSFDEIYQALRMSIKQDDKKWRYVVSVWPDHFVYEEDGETPSRSSSTRSTSSLTRS
jgi:3-methyladenine DNA glycosylase Mpg